MKRFYPFVILFAFWGTSAFSQKEASNWFFGDKLGFRFANNSVSPVAGGQFQYNEGASAISDCKGNLLFYTDGVTVWNRRHAVMVNGTGLLGHYSSTQGSIVVPFPGICDQYLIFTLDGKENGLANGLRYSVVDMSLQNGDGEVIQKNLLLYGPATEKMAAVQHSNGRDYWVVTHAMGTNAFVAWPVTSLGPGAAPVISNSGTPIGSVLDAIGQMKISPDGTRLAYVTLVNKLAEVFDFDASTGVVSNPLTISPAAFPVVGGLYGLEFSPDSKKMYITNHDIDYLNASGHLYQFSLDAGSPAAVLNSQALVGTNQPLTDLRGLQLGTDGRIYVSRSLGTYAGVIQQPNVAGIGCGYTDLGVATSGNACTWTFPSFISSYFRPGFRSEPIADFEFTGGCLDRPVIFENRSQNASEATWYWDFGDSAFSTISDPEHLYQNPGLYRVTLIVQSDCCSDTAYFDLEIKDCFFSVYVPNAFTPNGDGDNDALEIKGNGIESAELMVFNRWGEPVFHSANMVEGWSGKDAPEGLYCYLLRVRFNNGREEQKTGSVALIR